MNKVGVAVCLLLLSGCAQTLRETTSAKPDFVATTNKTSSAYAACLRDAWLDYGPTFVKPIAGGHRVFNSMGGEVGNAADATEMGESTLVKFFDPHFLMPKKFGEAARECL